MIEEGSRKRKTSYYLSPENLAWLTAEHRRTRLTKTEIVNQILEKQRTGFFQQLEDVLRKAIREEFAAGR